MRNPTSIWIVFLSLALVSCVGHQNFSHSKKNINLTEKQLIQLNRGWVAQQNTEIENFIKKEHWDMKETSTGLRYDIYHHGNGERAKVGRTVTIAYTVKLLNGTVVYSSVQSGLETFVVGHGNVPQGLEEGIILLKVGDKAKFILPSHLAYGLSGDGDKIPPDAPIIYNVELIQLK